MSLRDINIESTAVGVQRYIDASPATIAVSQTNKRCFAWKAPWAGVITDVQTYVATKAGALTFDVQIGATTCLASAAVTTADTAVQATLATAFSARKFKKGDVVSVVYTTDGSGAATNPSVMFAVRPYPMRGETGVGP